MRAIRARPRGCWRLRCVLPLLQVGRRVGATVGRVVATRAIRQRAAASALAWLDHAGKHANARHWRGGGLWLTFALGATTNARIAYALVAAAVWRAVSMAARLATTATSRRPTRRACELAKYCYRSHRLNSFTCRANVAVRNVCKSVFVYHKQARAMRAF